MPVGKGSLADMDVVGYFCVQHRDVMLRAFTNRCTQRVAFSRSPVCNYTSHIPIQTELPVIDCKKQ